MIRRALPALLLAGCFNVHDQVDLLGDSDTPAPSDDTDTPDLPDVDMSDVGEPIPFCINEVMANNRGSLELPNGATPDWFELYNPTTETVSLDGWQVADSPNPEAWTPLDGVALEPMGFLVLYADGADQPGTRHLPFELSSDGDTLVVRAPDTRRMTLNFPASAGDMAFARKSDCCTHGRCWDAVPYGTPASSNSLLGSVDTGP
ncbi:MAG TPA: lamin tail domain-containing protein [Myxococcota bacterium]|nr:lamin tail domain-containing protein [Myxococcota bacterium]